MPLPTDLDWQAQLLKEVGDPNGTISVLLPGAWALYASKAQIDARLPYWYAKRALLDVRAAEEQLSVDLALQPEIQAKRSQQYAHVMDMRQSANEEIVRIEAKARSVRVPAFGVIAATAPESPPAGQLANANDPLYQGDPYIDEITF